MADDRLSQRFVNARIDKTRTRAEQQALGRFKGGGHMASLERAGSPLKPPSEIAE
jgi:hypothetical protein